MTEIQNYNITSELYVGARTVIYRAKEKNSPRKVVIKVLKSEYPTPEDLKNFFHEYNIAKQLSSVDGVIRDYNIIDYKNTKAIIMEDFDAQSLDFIINEKNLNLLSLINIAIKITKAITLIHKSKIIHKDIKPQNILINLETGVVKVIDFGLSTQLNREVQSIVNLGHLEGTLSYISPEQTGRMNRSIDYRTDFYSLGITLYELFTGEKPFSSKDPMELVHAHIAKTAKAPHKVKEDIPEVLSKIIMKLLEKTAENRYQNGHTIVNDLEKCATQLEKESKIDNFVIAENDISGLFQIPEKLYGREKQISQLLEAFHSCAEGSSEALFISGKSGIGKSALINEIHKPIIQKRGFFISGKYEHLKKNIPYSAISQAFQELFKILLTESKEKIESWKKDILEAIGQNGQVMIDVIPELEIIIGKQPEVERLPAIESQNRFNMVFSNFIKVFARKDHPFVLCLDDLQWADNASFNLIQILISTESLNYFLFLGAYRENEVSKTHPFSIMCEKIKKDGYSWADITLLPLSFDSTSQLISETLYQELKEVEDLSKLVNSKTGGNPFFIKEFLKKLYEEELIELKKNWTWQLSKIKQTNITDNVVELMADKIKKLLPNTWQTMKIACCFGEGFDSSVLSLVSEKSEDDILKDLSEAINEGMLIKFEDAITFAHDRVREAAYSLITLNEQRELHYKIGKMLLDNTSREELENRLFSIATQLNLAQENLNNDEKRTLLEININAGMKAKLSAAYEASVGFFRHNSSLLPPNSWVNDYEKTLNYYTEWAEAEYLATNYDEAEELFKIVLENAQSLLDKIKIYSIEIDHYTSQTKFKEAIDVGKSALLELGITLPDDPDQNAAGPEIVEVNKNLEGREIKDLLDLPEMSDPMKIAAIEIMMKCIPPAYFSYPNLMVVIGLKMVNLSIINGNTPSSSYAYGVYAFILVGAIGDLQSGYEFGKLGVDLANKYGIKLLLGKVAYLFGATANQVRTPLRKCVDFLHTVSQISQEVGDWQYLGYSLTVFSYQDILAGKNLTQVKVDGFDKYGPLILSLKQPQNTRAFNTWRQTALCLLGETSERKLIKGDFYDESKEMPELLKTNDYNGLCHYYCNKLLLLYILDDYKKAAEIGETGSGYLAGLLGQPAIPFYHFFHTITLTALYTTSSQEEQKTLLEKINTISETFKPWAEQGTQNYMHKYKLIQAEIARITGEPMEKVAALYDEAISGAKKNRFIHEEAIANECAARYYLSKGRDKIAKSYMIEARYCYIKWGCKPKIELLEEKYPELFSSLALSSDSTTDISLGSISAASVATRSSSGALTTVMLDMNTIMKASQTIAGEIEMKNLLSRFMKIVIENAGAQKGLLVFKGENDNLLIEAESEVDQKEPSILQSIPLEESNSLSPAIIRYVDKTKEPLVLDNASEEGTFTRDDYIKSNNIVSVLCLPVIKQDKIIAILYLENNLTPGSFTPSRVETLRVLSSQAAISIENARMVEQMREKERLKREMELAERLQTSLVPPAPEHDELDIAVCMKPAEEVGGDYYDTIFDIEKKLWFAIGDVSGHGMTPGLVMMMAETAFHTHIIDSKGKTPRDAVIAVNKVLTENIRTRLKEKHFMTMSFVKYDGDGNFSHSGAHLDIMVYRKATGKVELFKTEGLYLGIMPDLTKIAQDKSFKLEIDDVMLLYTDGIIEAPKEDDNEKQFGKDTLIRLLEDKGEADAREIMESIKKATLDWCGINQDDDITMVVAKRKV